MNQSPCNEPIGILEEIDARTLDERMAKYTRRVFKNYHAPDHLGMIMREMKCTADEALTIALSIEEIAKSRHLMARPDQIKLDRMLGQLGIKVDIGKPLPKSMKSKRAYQKGCFGNSNKKRK